MVGPHFQAGRLLRLGWAWLGKAFGRRAGGRECSLTVYLVGVSPAPVCWSLAWSLTSPTHSAHAVACGVHMGVGMRTRAFVTLLTHIWLPEAHQGLADGMGGRARKLGWETGAMECSSATREVRATPRADG